MHEKGLYCGPPESVVSAHFVELIKICSNVCEVHGNRAQSLVMLWVFLLHELSHVKGVSEFIFTSLCFHLSDAVEHLHLQTAGHKILMHVSGKGNEKRRKGLLRGRKPKDRKMTSCEELTRKSSKGKELNPGLRPRKPRGSVIHHKDGSCHLTGASLIAQ